MDGEIIIGTKLDTKGFEEEIRQTEEKLNRLEKSYSKALDLNKKFGVNEKRLSELRLEIEKTGNKLVDLRKKQDALEKPGLSDIMNNASKSTANLITKIAKWGLALFGIQGAYSAIRSSISILSQYDDKLATDLDYIKFALATTLKPIIDFIVNGVFKILSYINAISIAMFNVNLFANASADAFANSKKNLSSANKSAKELKKQLAGFDEMNILQDTSDAGTGGVSGGSEGPSLDLSLNTMEEQGKKFKAFWKDIIDFWEKDWKNALGLFENNWGLAWDGVLLVGKGFYDAFKGIFELIKGVVDFFVAVFKGDMDGITKSIKLMGKGIVDIVVGLLELIGGLIVTLVGVIMGLILDLWDALKNIFNSLVNGIVDVFKKIGSFIGDWISARINDFKSFVEKVKSVIGVIFNFIGQIGTKAGEIIGSAFKVVINGVLGAIEGILNTPIKAINLLIKTINKIPGVKLGVLSEFKLPRLAKGGIINMPGRGVPVGGAIAAEKGAEGIIPLTDSQQMTLLGKAIGKFITINANITNSMNGRVISRELQKIQNDSDFALNS